MQSPFAALVLAGSRPERDPVAHAAGVSCKALAPVAGRALVLHVLDALRASPAIGPLWLSGPDRARLSECEELASLVAEGRVSWIATEASPAASTLRALRSMPDTAPVLVTTADHALLRPEMVEHFCARAVESGLDLVAGVASHEEVAAAFPELRRTALRFAGGAVSGCNLFAFLTPAARGAVELWIEVEHERKRPWRLVRKLGWTAVARYLLGRLTLEEALARLSRRTNVALGVVRMPFPAAAVDVDSPADLAFVRSRLEGGG